jgi:hypothetical protein
MFVDQERPRQFVSSDQIGTSRLFLMRLSSKPHEWPICVPRVVSLRSTSSFGSSVVSEVRDEALDSVEQCSVRTRARWCLLLRGRCSDLTGLSNASLSVRNEECCCEANKDILSDEDRESVALFWCLKRGIQMWRQKVGEWRGEIYAST